MSSRFRTSLLLLGSAALLVAGCSREERHSRSNPVGETVGAGPSPDTIFPGGTTPPPLDPRARLYDNNAPAIAEGQQLFTQMNCVGCHSHGGGGMGPALMDNEWRYGSSMANIVDTITNGRPNGMPAFAGKMTERQIWQVAAYVRTMSAHDRQDVRAGRADSISAGEPPTLRDPKKPVAVTPEHDEATVR